MLKPIVINGCSITAKDCWFALLAILTIVFKTTSVCNMSYTMLTLTKNQIDYFHSLHRQVISDVSPACIFSSLTTIPVPILPTPFSPYPFIPGSLFSDPQTSYFAIKFKHFYNKFSPFCLCLYEENANVLSCSKSLALTD